MTHLQKIASIGCGPRMEKIITSGLIIGVEFEIRECGDFEAEKDKIVRMKVGSVDAIVEVA